MLDTAASADPPPKPDPRLREFERFSRYLGLDRPYPRLRRGQRDRPGNVRIPCAYYRELDGDELTITTEELAALRRPRR